MKIFNTNIEEFLAPTSSSSNGDTYLICYEPYEGTEGGFSAYNAQGVNELNECEMSYDETRESNSDDIFEMFHQDSVAFMWVLKQDHESDWFTENIAITCDGYYPVTVTITNEVE